MGNCPGEEKLKSIVLTIPPSNSLAQFMRLSSVERGFKSRWG